MAAGQPAVVHVRLAPISEPGGRRAPAGTVTVGLRERRGPALLALLVSTFLIGMSAWVISTAVPSIVADIRRILLVPWLFSVYLLTMTVTVPVFSKLADTIGRKRLLMFGLVVFVLGSILCGLAWSMPSLIAFRVVQALGGGSIQPLALTVIGDLYHDRTERARVQGYLAVTLATASVLGPAISGLFAMFDLWRLVFFINLPLGALAAWLIHRNIQEKITRSRASGRCPRRRLVHGRTLPSHPRAAGGRRRVGVGVSDELSVFGGESFSSASSSGARPVRPNPSSRCRCSGAASWSCSRCWAS